MSLVTGVYIQFSVCDEENLEKVKQLFTESDYRKQQLNQIDEDLPGFKHPQIIMLAVGMNFWCGETIEDFWVKVVALTWTHPGYLVMVTTFENDEEAKIWKSDYKKPPKRVWCNVCDDWHDADS